MLGYGNFATSTFGGRLFCLIFGIIGIPFMLSVLADVGGLMAEGIEYAWVVNKDRIKYMAERLKLIKPSDSKVGDKEDDDIQLGSSSFQSNIITIVATLGTLFTVFAFGALLFTFWEVSKDH